MKTFLSIALAFTLIAPITTAMAANKKDNMKLADKPLVIVRQGQFNVGGTTLQRAGSYDNSKFVGWSEQDETGQRFQGDHAYVEYQIPQNAGRTPLIFVHGFGSSGACWQSTPDGHDSFQTLMTKLGNSTYVMDLPGRGRASRTTATSTVLPVADEMFWFDIWRMGIYPRWNEGIAFPTDSASVSQFFRLMVPDLSDHRQDVPAITQTVDKVGAAILVTHSAGGFPGWIVASKDKNVKGVAALEPEGSCSPRVRCLLPFKD